MGGEGSVGGLGSVGGILGSLAGSLLHRQVSFYVKTFNLLPYKTIFLGPPLIFHKIFIWQLKKNSLHLRYISLRVQIPQFYSNLFLLWVCFIVQAFYTLFFYSFWCFI